MLTSIKEFLCAAQSTNLMLWKTNSWAHSNLRNMSLGQDLAYSNHVASPPMDRAYLSLYLSNVW
jgi:hypothetical protein